MKKVCEECGEQFSSSTAICDDWLDAEKSFGCPGCGTFYVQKLDEARSTKWMTTLGGAIFVATSSIFVHALLTSDMVLLVYSLIQIGLLGGLVAVKSPRFVGRWERSGHRRLMD